MSLEDLYRFGKIQKHKTSQEEIKNLFDSARQKRGAAFYAHTDVVSEVEFNGLFNEAKVLITHIKARIKKEHPAYSKKI